MSVRDPSQCNWCRGRGCNYCPEAPTQQDQVAAFIEAAMAEGCDVIIEQRMFRVIPPGRMFPSAVIEARTHVHVWRFAGPERRVCATVGCSAVQRFVWDAKSTDRNGNWIDVQDAAPADLVRGFKRKRKVAA